MLDALERFFNWQMDMDWSWGPLVFLRPAQDVRLTAYFWLKLFVATVTAGAILASLLLFYDYISALHHQKKLAPVIATEAWMNATPFAYVFYVLGFVSLPCFPIHWAWNRRADRLNRETAPPVPAPAAAPGVWPPPPSRS